MTAAPPTNWPMNWRRWVGASASSGVTDSLFLCGSDGIVGTDVAFEVVDVE
jgi:hypothetical protein